MWAYVEASAEWTGSSGASPANARYPEPRSRLADSISSAAWRGDEGAEAPDEVGVRDALRPLHAERLRRQPEALETLGVGDGDGAEQADVALEHQLGGGHPGHQRDLRVPLLDRQRGAELEPEAAVPLGDHLLGDRQADAAAPHLALPAEDADLAQEPELLVGRAAVERPAGP